MSELFDEVDEEVRREQLKRLWDKYSILFIALMVLVVAAVGGWRGYQYLEAQKAAEAGAAFEKAAELSDQDKHAEAESAFTELAAKAPSRSRLRASFCSPLATRPFALRAISGSPSKSSRASRGSSKSETTSHNLLRSPSRKRLHA